MRDKQFVRTELRIRRRCAVRPHLVCRVPHSVCRVPHLVCRAPNLVCRAPHLVCRVPHLVCRMTHCVPRAPLGVPRAPLCAIYPTWQQFSPEQIRNYQCKRERLYTEGDRIPWFVDNTQKQSQLSKPFLWHICQSKGALLYAPHPAQRIVRPSEAIKFSVPSLPLHIDINDADHASVGKCGWKALGELHLGDGQLASQTV